MTGLYFGSFNPVHLGHLRLAEYIINQKLCDELWFVVSPCNPLKKQSDLLDEHLRIKMLELAIEGNPRLHTCDIEFAMPKPSYTIDTLKVLQQQYPHKQFSILIGSDNALVFDHWKDYTNILANYPILVYPRKCFDFSLVMDKYPQMQLLESPYFEISSTEIRSWIEQKKDAANWLHPQVHKYIYDHNLYSHPDSLYK